MSTKQIETTATALEVIETRQKQLFSLLSPPREIFDQAGYDLADIFLRDEIKAKLYELDDEFVDIFRGAKASRKVYNNIKKPLQEMESQVKGVMAEFKTGERQRQIEAVEKVNKVLQQGVDKRKGDRLAELVNNGEVEDALELLMTCQPKGDTQLVPQDVAFSPSKGVASNIVITKTFEMKDQSKLKSEFMIPEEVIPSHADVSKILRVVKRHGKAAEEIVGAGAITYKEEIGIASQRKNQ